MDYLTSLYLKTIQQLDPEARVVTLTSGPRQGQYRLLTQLKLPGHRSDDAPAAATPERAVRAYWNRIAAIPSDEWITFVPAANRPDEAYRWTDKGWLRRPL